MSYSLQLSVEYINANSRFRQACIALNWRSALGCILQGTGLRICILEQPLATPYNFSNHILLPQ
jgi:hypothetical protein